MSETFPRIGPLILQSLGDPRAAARTIMGLRLPPNVLWLAFGAVMVVSVVVFQTLGLFQPDPKPIEVQPGVFVDWPSLSPFMYAVLQGSLGVVFIFCVHWFGRAFGGQGELHDALAVMTWFQALMLVLQLGALVLMAVSPLFVLFAVAFMITAHFYCMSLFVAEIHGFSNGGLVFLGIALCGVGVFIGLLFLISIIMLLTGVGVPENV